MGCCWSRKTGGASKELAANLTRQLSNGKSPKHHALYTSSTENANQTAELQTAEDVSELVSNDQFIQNYEERFRDSVLIQKVTAKNCSEWLREYVEKVCRFILIDPLILSFTIQMWM